MRSLVLDVLNLKKSKSFACAMIVSHNRKLFITAQGRLEIGPVCLEANDIISVLFGGGNPLRLETLLWYWRALLSRRVFCTWSHGW